MKTFSGLFLAFFLIPLVGGQLRAAAPPGAGEWRESLDGRWQFTTDPKVVDQPGAAWDAITVPGNWDTLPAYATFKGKAWYRREFVVPQQWQGKQIRVRFEAVYHDATVTLGAQELGTHSGGYTPFEFDLTPRVQPGSTYTLTVGADSTYRRGAWWHWGGISRDVTLIANNAAHIVWQHIRCEPDLQAGTAQLFIRCKLVNSSDNPLQTTLAAQIDDVTDPALAKDISLPPHQDTVVELQTTLPKQRVRLWDFDHPNLYRLTTSLSAAGAVLHEQSDSFGIRKIQITKDSLLLNGERVRLCGFNRVSDSREFGNTEPDALVHQDVDLMKRAGANLSRLMHFPQAPNLLDYLDHKGMLIWCEIPVWGGDDALVNSPESPLPRQWMTEMIERDYNHPCIIGWSVGNELSHHYKYVQSMIDFTRGLDPHRIITHVSNSGVRNEYTPANDPISVSDITLYNSYGGKNAAAILRGKWPDKPIFFSEFGIKQFGASPEAKIPGLEDFYHSVTSVPYVIGVSLWTFNDYRSDYKNTPASGNREWGVVDVQRRPKAAYEQVRKLFSPVHALSSAGGRVRIEPRRPDEVPSYTLRDYKITWDGGQIAVPDLAPGAAAWTAPIAAQPGTVINLVTPTGYVVDECR